MKKIKSWLRADRRYVTLLQALILAAIPVIVCLIRCALDGRGIGDTYLPGSEWNDELFYFKQVEAIIEYGYPRGYFGFNESHALKLSFAAWSPVLVWPWLIWGFLFGWNLLSPIICNIVLLSAAFFVFVLLVKPTGKQFGAMVLLTLLFTPFSRFMLSCMPEIICFSMLIVFYGVAVNYLRREKTWKLVLLFVMASTMVLMRPYLLLFLFLPAYLWIRKNKLCGIIGSVVIIGVVGAVYAWINHYLGAKYFAPLFFTDWIEAFFTRGFFGGVKHFFGKLYYMGTDFIRYTIQGCRTGLAAGSYFAGYIIMGLILAVQDYIDFSEYRRIRKSLADKKEAEEREPVLQSLENIGNRLIIQTHLLFSFVAMFFALLLMYKLTEGSKHLLTFMAAGIFVVALMESKFYKKIVLLGVTFAYFYIQMAIDPYDFQVPFTEPALEAHAKQWENTFDKELHLITEGQQPTFDNVVIWVFNDELPDGSFQNVAWQYLYYLPEGFGVSCCTADYVLENLEDLNSKYIATLSNGKIDQKCKEAGFVEIGREADLVLYEK